jgi:hypothetical protein
MTPIEPKLAFYVPSRANPSGELSSLTMESFLSCQLLLARYAVYFDNNEND